MLLLRGDDLAMVEYLPAAPVRVAGLLPLPSPSFSGGEGLGVGGG
jgi:hypothetical protein